MTQEATHTHGTRRRLVLDLPTDLYDGLRTVAAANYRDGKREAIRLITEGVEREKAAAESRRGTGP